MPGKTSTYLLSLCCLLLTACAGNKRAELALQQAEHAMASAPDSALLILQRIDPDDISSRRTRAEYALLYSVALERNNIPTDNDSLVRIARSYYRRHDDLRKRFLAEYCYASVLQNRNEDARALVHFLRIEEDGRRLNDPYLLAQLYTRIDGIYRDHFNYPSMLQYARLACARFRIARRKHLRARTLHDMGEAHYYLGQYDSAALYYNRSLRIAEAECDTSMMQHVMTSLAWARIRHKQPEEACAELWRIRCQLRHEWSDCDRAAMVLAHLTAGRIDSACHYLRSAEALVGPDSPAQGLLNDVAAEVHFKTGNFRKAAEELRRGVRLKDSLDRIAVQNSFADIHRDFLDRQHRTAQRRLRGMRHNLVLTIALAVALILLVGFVAYANYRKRQLAAQDHLATIDEIKNVNKLMLFNLQTQHRSETEELLRLVRNRFAVIDELGSTYYERQGANEQRAIYNKVKELFRSYASDAKSKQEIENAVNMCHDNVISRLREELPHLKESEIDLLCYIFAGFSLRVISVFTGDTLNYIAVKKSRLKTKIKDSDAPSKTLFLELMS